MPGTFDYYVSELACPVCRSVSKKDSSTNMQTKIFKYPGPNCYSVGDSPAIDNDWTIEDAGYYCIKIPQEDLSFVIVDSWECPACDAAFNFAAIRFAQGKIVSITNHDVFGSSEDRDVNFLTHDIDYVMEGRDTHFPTDA